MKRRLLVAAGVAFSMCLTGCGILPTEEEFDAAPVVKEYEGASFNKVAVTRGTLAKTEEISGKYKGTVKEDIEPDGASVIKKIYVKKGDRVKAGDVIMQYELPGSEKTLKESNEKIAKAELQIKQAKELMTLEVEKQKKTGGGKSGIENAKNQYEQQIKALESSLELLKMDAKIAKEEIKEEQITASVNGVVTYVDSKYASHCKEGDTVTIEVKGQEYKATIKRDKESTDSVYFYPKTKLNMEDGTVCSYQVVLKERKDILYLPSSIVYSMGDKHVV